VRKGRGGHNGEKEGKKDEGEHFWGLGLELRVGVEGWS